MAKTAQPDQPMLLPDDALIDHLTPIQAVAVVLMTMSEEAAGKVMSCFNSDEIQRIADTMLTVQDTPAETVRRAVNFTIERLAEPAGLATNAEEFVRGVMSKAIGEDKARGMMDKIAIGRNTAGLEPLRFMEPRQIAELIRNEHTQIVAILLAHLDEEQTAGVIKYLPPVMATEVMQRIATMEGIPPSALLELNEVMQRQFNGTDTENIRSSNMGGVRVAANIFNLMERGVDEQLLNRMAEEDEEMVAQIRELMFVFDNLVDLDSRTIQTILRHLSTDRLAIALRGAEDHVKHHIMSNMSERAATIMLEDMEARGPVRLTEVESAQKEILAVVRKLAEEGVIALSVKQEELV